MNFADRLRNIQVSPAVAGSSIVGLIVIAAIVIMMISKSSNNISSVDTDNTESAINMIKPNNDLSDSTLPTQKSPKNAVSLVDSVQIIASRNIFRPMKSDILKSESIEEAESEYAAPAPNIPPMNISGVQGMSPFGGFGNSGGTGSSAGTNNIAFTGIVNTPNGTMALLENTSTSETKFVSMGESAFGMQVIGINPNMVTLSSGMSTISLSLGENKKDAVQPTGANVAGTQGQPGNRGGFTPPWMGGQNQPAGGGANNNSGNQSAPGMMMGGPMGMGQFPGFGGPPPGF